MEYTINIIPAGLIAMHRYTLRSPLSLLIIVAASVGAQTQSPLPYPSTARGNQVDVYHGVSIADPYRWLEDTDSPETKAWLWRSQPACVRLEPKSCPRASTPARILFTATTTPTL